MSIGSKIRRVVIDDPPRPLKLKPRQEIQREPKDLARSAVIKRCGKFSFICWFGAVTARPPRSLPVAAALLLGGNRPSGSSSPYYEASARLYHDCLSDDGRVAVVANAKKAIQTRRLSGPSEDLTLDEIVIDDGEGFDAEHVAQRYGLSAAHVRRIRTRAGRGADDGASVEAASGLTRAERQTEVRRLRDKNLSQRQIAARLGVSQGLVSKDLRATEEGGTG